MKQQQELATQADVISAVKYLIYQSRQHIYQVINVTMTTTYWQIGKHIVDIEQQGENRAQYGKKLLKALSEALTSEFGKGFSVDNLENMRKFYLAFPAEENLQKIRESVSDF